MVFMLLVGCSTNGVTWSTPQIHGDNRSPSERYQDCLSRKEKSERSKCYEKAKSPDPYYMGVSFPVKF